MKGNTVNRPDEAAMLCVLEKYQMNATGAILRLAWQAGLMREEITGLRWEQVAFLDHMIELPDRKVPLDTELEKYLWEMHRQWVRTSEYVVFSERFRKQMQPQAISRIARRALDEAGMTEVRLVDLRHDYIIRQMERHEWGYVARITGVEVRTLHENFSSYVPKTKRLHKKKGEEEQKIDEFRLWKILQAEKETPAGLGLWLTWQLGLTGNEIVSLTWQQVDFAWGVLHLPGREVTMTSAVTHLLEQRFQTRGEDPHILVTEKTGKGMDISWLSRITRAALIRGGMEHFSLKDLQQYALRSAEDARIIEYVQQKETISRIELMDLLDISKTAAYNRLRRLAEEKKLVRVGGKYYLYGTVVPPEEHRSVICAYLEREGFAYRQDIAEVLCIQQKQCSRLLRRMVKDGELRRVDQRYYLKEA